MKITKVKCHWCMREYIVELLDEVDYYFCSISCREAWERDTEKIGREGE